MLIQRQRPRLTIAQHGLRGAAVFLLLSTAWLVPGSVLAKDMPAQQASITAVSPTTVAAGDVLTIAGQHLGHRGAVRLGDRDCAIVSASPEEFSCRVPSDMERGSVRVSLTTGAGEVLTGPAVEIGARGSVVRGGRLPYLSRAGGVAVRSIEASEDWTYPRRVTLVGHGFGNRQGNARILISGMEAEIVSWSARNIVFHARPTTPAQWHDVTLLINGVRMDAGQFGVRPQVTAIELDEGASRRRLILRGAHFGDDVTPRHVVFGGWHEAWTADIERWSATEIIAAIPPALPAGTHPLWVLLDGIPGNRSMIEVGARIVRILPQAVYPGEEVTIHGRNFSALDVNDIRLDGEPVRLVEWSASRIRLVVPENIRSGDRQLVLRADSAAPLRTRIMIMHQTSEQNDPRWDQPAFDQSW